MTDQDSTPPEDDMPADEIGDIEPDDTHDDADGDVDWSNVDEVAKQVEEIDAIEDEDEKTEAAKQWAARLGGEG